MHDELPLAAHCEALHRLLDELPLPQEDFVVPLQALLHPTGALLQKKRSQIRQFQQAAPEWQAQPLGSGLLDAAYLLEHRWQTAPDSPRQTYVRRCFRSFEELGLCGVLLTTGRGQPAGYALAAACGSVGSYILALRALPAPAGAAAMLYCQLAGVLHRQLPQVQWVNLGWLGGEQERQSRLSYHPLDVTKL